MPSVADRVKETTTTTGTGTISLGGAITGFIAFSTAFVTGTVVYYCITDGTNWEVGYGTLTSGAPWTLSRTTVLASSNAGALVNFPGPSSTVFNTVPAAATILSTNSIRQTISNGPVDTAGLPTIFPATFASLVVTTQNISTGANALVATAAGGSTLMGDVNSIGVATANITWPACTANNTNFLPVAVAGGTLTAQTPVTLVPIYQFGGTPSVTAGQYTFNVQQMTMYLGNGATAPAVNHVIVGEAVAGASTITSTVAYAYNGRYQSGDTATLPTTATVVSANHNIGITPDLIVGDFYVICTTAEQNFSIGDVVSNMATVPNDTVLLSGTIMPIVTRNAIQIATGSYQAFHMINKTTGAGFSPTAADWAYAFRARRVF